MEISWEGEKQKKDKLNQWEQGERGKEKEAYANNGQETNVVTQELSKEEEVIVGLFLVELLNFFFHLSQLGECP